MRRLIYLVLSFCVVLGLGSAGTGFWVYSGFTRPGPLKHDTILIIRLIYDYNYLKKTI